MKKLCMKTLTLLVLCAPWLVQARAARAGSTEFDLCPVLEVKLGEPVGQLRAVPVDLGKGRPKAILAVHCPDAEVDPYVEMFFFPKGTLKVTLFTMDGKILWRRDLGPGVVPGIWFSPVYPFDLDGDGIHELVRGLAEGNGDALDNKGRIVRNINGKRVIGSKLLDLPGEQILCYRPDGTVYIWADGNAKDSAEAQKRYSNRFYRANQKLSATGCNVMNLGGL